MRRIFCGRSVTYADRIGAPAPVADAGPASVCPNAHVPRRATAGGYGGQAAWATVHPNARGAGQLMGARRAEPQKTSPPWTAGSRIHYPPQAAPRRRSRRVRLLGVVGGIALADFAPRGIVADVPPYQVDAPTNATVLLYRTGIRKRMS